MSPLAALSGALRADQEVRGATDVRCGCSVYTTRDASLAVLSVSGSLFMIVSSLSEPRAGGEFDFVH